MDPDFSTPGGSWGEEKVWGILQDPNPWKLALCDPEPKSGRVRVERAWTRTWALGVSARLCPAVACHCLGAPPFLHPEDGVDAASPSQGCCEPALCAGGRPGLTVLS